MSSKKEKVQSTPKAEGGSKHGSDTADNIGHLEKAMAQSHVNSRRSRVSVKSEKAKLAARRKILEAEAAALKAQQQLEMEEMEIRLRREREDLQMQQRKASARLEADLSITAAQEEALGQEDVFSEHSSTQQSISTHLTSISVAEHDKIQPSVQRDIHAWVEDIKKEDDAPSSIQIQQKLMDIALLPKTEITRFDGNPLKYWSFIRTFDNVVEKETIDCASKLLRLVQYCTGNAKKVIECCLTMEPDQGYPKARELLQQRFGNNFIISEAYIKTLTERPTIRPNQTAALRDFSDDLQICVQTLTVSGYLGEINTQGTLAKIISKLPTYLQNRWRRQVTVVRGQNRRPDINDVSQFLLEAAEEANDPVFGQVPEKKTEPRERYDRRTHTFTTAASQSPDSCTMCDGSHAPFGCDYFKSMKVPDRVKLVQEKRLCFNCLKPGHIAKKCGLTRRCTVCGRKHTKFLHLPTEVRYETTRSNHDSGGATIPKIQGNSGYISKDQGHRRVVLPIVPVVVRGVDSQVEIATYALLDSGSTHSFCTTDLAQRLQLDGEARILSLTTLEKADSQIKTTAVRLEVRGIGEECIQLNTVYTRPAMPINLEHMAKPQDIQKWGHLKDLSLPFVESDKVTLLIGQDSPQALMPIDVRSGKPGEPYAVKTLLGWTLNGPTGNTDSPKVSSSFIEVEENLEVQLHKFWQVEGIDSFTDERSMSYNDRKVIGVWENSLKQHEDCHYEAAIPFKKRPPPLLDNQHVAQQRLENLRKKLEKNPVLKQAYCSYMEDLLCHGYAEKTPMPAENDMPVWYLPHHSVVNPRKPEKTRVVFDCSVKYKGTSLNEQVYQGPDLTNNLLGVLLRFREEPVAIMADIESMFHQVRVPPSDRNVLRFLWWPSGDMSKPAEDYRMTVHLFGGTWCPSICSFVLRHTAEQNQTACDDVVVETVKKNFYVDDYLEAVADVDTAEKRISQLCGLLSSGGFRLTKWTSNSREVLNTVPIDERAKGVKVDLNHEALPVERALGVYWNAEEDTFCFKMMPKNKPLTRRGLLSMVSSIYDPFGFAGPVIIEAKRILQDLTRKKLTWDEPIPYPEREQWKKWISDLPRIEEMKINRCVKQTDMMQNPVHTLHYFSDASETAYGVVVYLLTTDENKVCCSLLMAKSRLAPIKKITIPRLELMAASMSVKVNHAIMKEIGITVTDSVFWTDSMTVLRYIANDDKRYHTFVANRVSAIRSGSQPSQWRFVESKNNPADAISRGQRVDEYLSNTLWFEGPEYLRRDREGWPKIDVATLKIENDVEVKANVTVSERVEEAPVQKILQRRSSWYKLKKDIAWWLRLKDWLRAKVNPSAVFKCGPLTVEEIDKASNEIVKCVQAEVFSKEIAALRESGSSSAILKKNNLHRLMPQILDGVLVVGGRLENAPVADTLKHPAILPKHHVSNLVIQHFHHMSGHSGREHVLAKTREQYWIIGARTAIRQVIKNCFSCRRRHAPCGTQKMADLPVSRVTPGDPPFTSVGVDYFGPFHVKQGRKLIKRYGCLFTCLTVRAVHIEIAHSMDTSSFINALQRFISRRGMPKEIYSDNGTNFIGAEKELRDAVQGWNQTKLGEFCRQREIEWHFNPPAASHMGGSWERQIRTVRKVLGGVMREQTVDDEGLSTFMCLVEGIVNSRPLTNVSDDPRDPEPLTPNHLLLLRSGPVFPPGRFLKEDLCSRRRWRQIQYLADIFWKRWIREYLPLLQSRQKWMDIKRDLKIGDVVLIADNNAPRNLWKIATVIKTFPGRDGHVRSAEVQTVSTTLIRPITKLCLLEEVTECRTV